MNGPYSSDNFREMDESAEQEREISLGASTVLGIFFALALVCALFFGFGYSVGRRSAQTVATTQETTPAGSSASKPSSGSAESHTATGNSSISESSDGAKTAEPADSPAIAPPSDNSAPASAFEPKTVTVDTQPSSKSATSSAKAAAKAPVAPGSGSQVGPAIAGSIMVQIAAVSHREDADILISTLTRRGYDVAIRQEPQDKLLHVQIGPFSNRKDADAMRQRLLTDGYNAIVK